MAAPRTIDPENGRTRMLSAMIALNVWEQLHSEAERSGRSMSAVTRDVLELGLQSMTAGQVQLEGAA